MKSLKNCLYMCLVLVLLFNTVFCQQLLAFFSDSFVKTIDITSGSVETEILDLDFNDTSSLSLNSSREFSFSIQNRGKSSLQCFLNITFLFEDISLTNTDMFFIYPATIDDQTILDRLKNNDYTDTFTNPQIFNLNKDEYRQYSLKIFFYANDEVKQNQSKYNNQELNVNILLDADVRQRNTGWALKNIKTLKTLLQVQDGFIKLVSGDYHALALTSDGKVYVWGINIDGELGDGKSQNRLTPYELTGLDFIIDIAANKSSSYVLTDNGEIYSFGHNGYGHLGNGNTKSSRVPVRVNTPQGVKFKSITAKYNTAGAISTDNEVYTWGYGGNGTLGNGINNEINSNPVKISVENVKLLQLGDNEGAAVTYDNQLFVWGANNNGQLGIGTYDSTIYPPTQITYFSSRSIEIESLSVGLSHMAIITKDNRLYTWGYGSNGCLATGTTSFKNAPSVVSLSFTPQRVFSQSENMAIVDSNGKIYLLGKNYYNKLGSSDDTVLSPYLFSQLQNPTDIALAADATLFLVDSEVYSIGSGAYGILATGNTNSTTQLVKWAFTRET